MAETVTSKAYRRRLAAQAAGGPAVPPIAYIAVGDGGHNPDGTPKPPSDEAVGLNHELLRKSLTSITQPTVYSVTGTAVITINELNGKYLSEFALLDAAGNICGLRTSSPKIKDDDEDYRINLKLNF